jgi:hypothetical protein
MRRSRQQRRRRRRPRRAGRRASRRRRRRRRPRSLLHPGAKTEELQPLGPDPLESEANRKTYINFWR